jgi:hypothetical protein
MTTQEKIQLADKVLGSFGNNGVNRIGDDYSILERTNEAKIILTQDNRELLTD